MCIPHAKALVLPLSGSGPVQLSVLSGSLYRGRAKTPSSCLSLVFLEVVYRGNQNEGSLDKGRPTSSCLFSSTKVCYLPGHRSSRPRLGRLSKGQYHTQSEVRPVLTPSHGSSPVNWPIISKHVLPEATSAESVSTAQQDVATDHRETWNTRQSGSHGLANNKIICMPLSPSTKYGGHVDRETARSSKLKPTKCSPEHPGSGGIAMDWSKANTFGEDEDTR